MGTTPQKPIEDAIVALTTNTPELYGEPFFHWARLRDGPHWQADLLADELTTLAIGGATQFQVIS